MPKTTRAKAAPKAARMEKSQVEKYLTRVPEAHVFWVCDGRVLRDIGELRDALVSMSDQTYAYHANESKNDFTNWIRDIIGDEQLAKDLEKVVNREQSARIVLERHTFLTNQAS
jgi:hypothetical protein